MNVRIRGFVFALVMVISLCFFVSCGAKDGDNVSSALVQSEAQGTQNDINTSGETKSENEENTSIVETSSVSDETSSNNKKPVQRPTDENQTSSASSSESQSIKVYRNPKNIGLMCYSLNMSTATAYGEDFESRKRYFEEIVNEGYFNQFILHAGQYLLTEAEIIAKAGGSFWIMCTKNGTDVEYALDAYVSVLERHINELEEAGYKNLLNGFFWDEPRWGNGISNDQYLTLTKTLYQKFGLRNYAVFATGEFTSFEGNEGALGIGADEMKKISRKAMQYLTDVGYDSYCVDVRPGADNGGDSKFPSWQYEISPNIVDGKTYYQEYRKELIEHCGHEANFWYYPTAWTTFLYGGLNGETNSNSEEYWIAHLDFMAQDLLTIDYPGGLCIYTFRRTDNDNNDAFERRMDLKAELGNWAVYPEYDKFETYCKKLRNWCSVFSSRNPKFVKLSVK